MPPGTTLGGVRDGRCNPATSISMSQLAYGFDGRVRSPPGCVSRMSILNFWGRPDALHTLRSTSRAPAVLKRRQRHNFPRANGQFRNRGIRVHTLRSSSDPSVGAAWRVLRHRVRHPDSLERRGSDLSRFEWRTGVSNTTSGTGPVELLA